MKKLVFGIIAVLFTAMICIGNEGFGNEDTGSESTKNENIKSESAGNEGMKNEDVKNEGKEKESMESKGTGNESVKSEDAKDKSRYTFQFTSDYIRSLKQLKAIEKETSAFNRQHENDIQYREATVTYLRRANKELHEARDMVSKYENSEDQLVKSAADSILLLYDNLSEIQFQTIEMYEGLDNPEKFDIKSFMDKSNELQLSRDKFLQAFNDTAIIVTYALVSWEPDESGRLSYLAISRNQRGSLVKQLGDTFGGEEGDGMQDGQTYLNSCGAILLKVLIGDHKSSDER